MTDENELEHLAPLSTDSVPDANQSHFCFSCESPMTGLYCANCGQKNDNYRRSIYDLGTELFTSLTALENRIWRTWRALLFSPGKVAREYANGRRSHWSSPIRIYLAISILLFGYMGITQTHLFSLDMNVTPKPGIEKAEEDMTAEDLQFQIKTHIFETQKQINARNTDRNFTLIDRKLRGSTTQNGLKFNIDIGDDTASETDTSDETPDAGASTDRSTQDIDEARAAIKDALDEIDTLPTGQVTVDDMSELIIRFMKNPKVVTQQFNTWLPRIMFFMMPFTMVLGWVFIRGRGNALMYDHLVHAAYLHAFGFFLLFIGILLSRFIPTVIIFRVILVALIIYLPLSLKTMFRRGWVKTIWTSYAVAVIYLLLIVMLMIFFVGRGLFTEIVSAA